jgi:hypothetical protein
VLQRREAEHADVGAAAEKAEQGLKGEQSKEFEVTRIPRAGAYILE